MNLFIDIRVLDVLDILLVASLLYFLYSLIKGTVAFNIFIGVFIIYLFWLLVKALNMELISSLMGQFISVGVLALIVVFQPEIRRFLLLIGSNERVTKILRFRMESLFTSDKYGIISGKRLKMIVKACESMARTNTGALIVISQTSELGEYVATGEEIKAMISDALMETIFFKNTPLHDGAMIIAGGQILAARCILPITDKQNIDPSLGLRHRAAIGISEITDAVAIVVSEEKGRISVARNGHLQVNVSLAELSKLLNSIMHPEVAKEEQEE